VEQQQFVRGRLEAVQTRYLLGREIHVQIDALMMAGFEHAMVVNDTADRKVDVSQEPKLAV
jgi:hypothetical protein